ncbi:MAG TPA: M48 family metallopeptidase [Longimicrobium sp.]|nr:M48 family metallopeptidase [Longimicrobium sp.]
MPILRALLVVLAVVLAAPARAQAPAAAPAPAASSAQAAPRSTDRVAVPKPSEKAVRYHRGNLALWGVGLLWAFAIPAALLFTGASARIRDGARRIGRHDFFTIALYLAALSVILWLANFPLDYYGFTRKHAYGLSNQTFGAWMGDSLKGLGIGIVGLALTMWLPYWLLKKSPGRWWLYTALGAIPLVIFLTWFQPIVIDPMFDDFGAMSDKRLESAILAEAQRAGIEGGRVFEVAKSKDTNAINAYVTGFGGSKRIVLWDTLLRKMDERETIFVMGHEMGHYVLGHVVGRLAMAVALILVGLYTVHRASGWLIARYRDRFGFTELADIASYPLLILIFGAVGLVATPLANGLTRYQEHEADRFGLELTRDNHSAATAFTKLQSENLAVPYPGMLYTIFRASHPPLGERIDFANEYRPWETGGRMRYAERFRGTRPAGR